jgi:hypothetical protein
LQIATHGHRYQSVNNLLNNLRREAFQNGSTQQRNLGGEWVAGAALVSCRETPLNIVALLCHGILLGRVIANLLQRTKLEKAVQSRL